MVVASDPTSIQARPELLSAASRCAARGGDKAGIYQVEEVSKGRVRIRVGERDRSDEMRSVMMRGRRPCLEFRGALGDTLASDGWLRSVIRAKFRVSSAVATWDARTLSTATRLFTNSTDNCMLMNTQQVQIKQVRLRNCEDMMLAHTHAPKY